MSVKRIYGIAAFLIVLVVVGAFFVPGQIRQTIEGEIGARTGCEAHVASYSVRSTGLSIEGLQLTCPFGDASLDHVEVDRPWFGGRTTAIRARGGRVSLGALPTRPAPAGDEALGATGESGSRRFPRVTLEGIRVALGGEAGELVHADVDAGLDDGELTLEVRALATSPHLHPEVELSSGEARLDLRGRQLLGGTATGLRLSSNAGDSLLDALRRFVRGAEDGESDEGEEAGELARAPWRRLAEGASIRVDGASIRDAEGTPIAELELELTRIEGSRLHTSGRGTPRGAGRMSWDLRVDADAEAADGPIELESVPLSVFTPFLPTMPIDDSADATLSGALTVRTLGSRVAFDGRLSVARLALSNPRISSAPVRDISFAWQGRGAWDRAEHALSLERSTIELGRARASIVGRALLDGDRYAIELEASLPDTPCEDAVHAIPAGFLQGLEAFHLEGRIGGEIVLSVDSERLDAAVLRFAIRDRCRFTSAPALADLQRFQQPFRHEVLEPDGSVFAMETGPGTAAWARIETISPFLLHAVLAHEDASFFTHGGFAPWAIRDALVRNLRERRYVLGASTITMQLVKNVFLRREKTLARKVQEVLLTWWIERSWSKAQILELYLNVIEYGPSVYGIRSAAQHYFGRDPMDLTAAEAAYLAMILPNPPRFHEQWESGTISPSFRRRVAAFVGILERRGRITVEAADAARAELEAFSFSREGERVGPERFVAGWAPLPIEGLLLSSGHWEDDEPSEGGDGADDEREGADDARWEAWP